ncbi:MAG: GNAT family N-acetyltransferase [Actinomycetota bacterium]
MGVTIGPVSSDRADEYLGVMGRAFGFDSEPEDIERFNHTFEWDRAWAAYDGDRMVGTVGAFSLDMTVPGSTMACGGTTVVSVLPTHRRQGILRMMIDSHLEDVRDHSEPIAGLWASDSGIYGRFGYGLAAREAEIEVSRDNSSFHRLAPARTPVRLIAADEAADLLPGFYDTQRRRYPGFLARSAAWWKYRRLRDRRSDRDGATAYRFAVTEENGVVTGFVQFRFKEKWTKGHGAGELKIKELLGSDPESWAGLWRFVLDHDLTSVITAYHRPLDDPLYGLLAAPRRARSVVEDSLWIRIMDIPAALEGRAYGASARAILEIRDPLTSTTSVWEADLSPDGSRVAATDQEPQVALDLEDLGACFMGWSRFQELAAAGRLEGDPAALADLDRAFMWHPAPWCNEVF